MEPTILLVGKIQPIMDILRDELNRNYGRDVISSSSKEHVEAQVKTGEIDLVILGAGFSDDVRDDMAEMIKSIAPQMTLYQVPRVGEKSPAKLIPLTNQKAVEWKFFKIMGKKPGPPKM